MSIGHARPLESASALPALLAAGLEEANGQASHPLTDAVDRLCEAMRPAPASAPFSPNTCPVLVRVVLGDRKHCG